MKSDLTCPVEVVSVRLGQETFGEAENAREQLVCVIEFFNLSDRVIDSLQMNIICFAADGTRIGGRLVRAAARGEGRARFSGAFMPERVDGTDRVEASVEKVWFEGGMVWRREERNVREYTPNALPEGRELDRLRAVAGPDAAGYAREDDIVWMCVCGRANRTSDGKCLRCERERTAVLRDYCFTAIDSTVGRKERMLEQQTMETMRRSSEETAKQVAKEKKKEKRKRTRLNALIVLLILAILALVAARWGVPYAAGMYAQYEMGLGHAADAKEIYLLIDKYWPGFGGAGEHAKEAETVIIEGLITANTDESLENAARRALELDTQGAAALHERAVMARAKLAIAGGDTDSAEALLGGLPGSEAAQKLLRELVRSIADKAMERTDYPTAIARYESLGDEGDAQAMKAECIDLYGRQLMREGNYALACEQFLQVTDREDVIPLIRQCRYALAGERMEDGDYIEAAALYETLGVYEEAELRAMYCRYTAGMEALDAGMLEEAVIQLKLANDYEDAHAQYTQASFMLGSAAMNEGRYADAVRWLEQLDREGEIAKAYEFCVYTYARQLEDAGQLEPAQQQFALAGEYEDAPERIRGIEYTLAVREMKLSPEAALARFEALGEYKDAADKADACRYMIAAAAYDKGDYAAALEGFSALGEYEDSMGQMQRSRYALAAQKGAQGQYAEAAALYTACGVYLDAEERAMRMQYDAAAALETAGDYAAAAKAFEAVGSYEDAKVRMRRCEDAWLQDAYQAAVMDMELGDYASVIAGLEAFAGSELPARYASIDEMYREACIARGEELIEQGRPHDALPVLERVTDSQRVDKMLGAYVFGVIGRWKDLQGGEYIFRRDGSCSILGVECWYGGEAYDLYIGEERYPTKAAYSVVDLRKNTLSLRRLEDKKNIRLTYLGEPTPAPVPEPALTEATAGEAQRAEP